MKLTFGTDDLMKAAERMALYTELTADDINAIRRNLIGDGYKDQVIEEWKKEITEVPQQDVPCLFWEGSDIADKFAYGCITENVKGAAASEDKTYSTVTANGVEGTFYLVRGNVKVAMAPVVAVRYRTSSLKDGSYFEIFAYNLADSR